MLFSYVCVQWGNAPAQHGRICTVYGVQRNEERGEGKREHLDSYNDFHKQLSRNRVENGNCCVEIPLTKSEPISVASVATTMASLLCWHNFLARCLCVSLSLSIFLSYFFQRTNSDTQRMVYYCICRWTWCQCSWSLQISIVVVTIWSACHDNAAEGIVRWPSSDIKCTHTCTAHPSTLIQLHHQHSADKFFRLRLNLSMWRNNDASPLNKFPFMPFCRRSHRPLTAYDDDDDGTAGVKKKMKTSQSAGRTIRRRWCVDVKWTDEMH